MPSTKRFRVLAAAALLLLPVLALAAPPARVAPKNLLANPGFERSRPGHEWMPADWDTSDSGLSTVFFGRDTLIAHGGKWSVNIANTSTAFAMPNNWSQTLLIGRETWGRTAVVSVWTRSAGVEGRAYLLAQAYRDTVTKMAQIWGIDREEASSRMAINKIDDPLIDFAWQRQQFEEENTGWVRREVRIYVGAGSNVLFVRCGLIGTGQLYLDDASIVLEPAPPAPVYAIGQNVLLDPGFEAGALAWEWVVPPFPGASLERDSTVAHSGRMSMLASGMRDGVTNTRMGMCQSVPGRGLAGKHVRLSGWFRGDSLRSSAYVVLYCQTAHGVVQSPGTQMYSMTFDWSEAAVEMDVPDDTRQIWAWLAFNAPALGRVWFDDATLKVLGPSSTARPRSAAPPHRR
jgi:hypothetical protein